MGEKKNRIRAIKNDPEKMGTSIISLQNRQLLKRMKIDKSKWENERERQKNKELKKMNTKKRLLKPLLKMQLKKKNGKGA